MTKEQIKQILTELEGEDDYNGLVRHTLHHIKEDKSAKPITGVEEIFARPNPNIKVDVVEEGYYVLADYTLLNEQAKRVITTIYFIVAALDTVVEKAIVSKRDFKDSNNSNIFRLQQILLSDVRGSLFTSRYPSFFLQFVNTQNQAEPKEIDITIRVGFDKTRGYMNGPLALKVITNIDNSFVSEDVDFIKCLEDINFANIQKAINIVC